MLIMSSTVSVGIISDTHSYLDPSVAEVFAEVDHILHAGDIGNEEVLEALEAIAPTTAVKGNIDGGNLRFLPEEAEVTLGGKLFAIRHICGSPKRPNKATRALLSRVRPDFLIVGHSHIPVITKIHDTLWINPGAAGREGFHDIRLAARMHIDADTGEVRMERVDFGPRVPTYH